MPYKEKNNTSPTSDQFTERETENRVIERETMRKTTPKHNNDNNNQHNDDDAETGAHTKSLGHTISQHDIESRETSISHLFINNNNNNASSLRDDDSPSITITTSPSEINQEKVNIHRKKTVSQEIDYMIQVIESGIFSQHVADEKLLIDALIKLKRMIGLGKTKQKILEKIQFLLLNQNNTEGHLLHTFLCGGPGIGKTSLSRILAELWCGLGLFENNKDKKTTAADTIGVSDSTRIHPSSDSVDARKQQQHFKTPSPSCKRKLDFSNKNPISSPRPDIDISNNDTSHDERDLINEIFQDLYHSENNQCKPEHVATDTFTTKTSKELFVEYTIQFVLLSHALQYYVQRMKQRVQDKLSRERLSTTSTLHMIHNESSVNFTLRAQQLLTELNMCAVIFHEYFCDILTLNSIQSDMLRDKLNLFKSQYRNREIENVIENALQKILQDTSEPSASKLYLSYLPSELRVKYTTKNYGKILNTVPVISNILDTLDVLISQQQQQQQQLEKNDDSKHMLSRHVNVVKICVSELSHTLQKSMSYWQSLLFYDAKITPYNEIGQHQQQQHDLNRHNVKQPNTLPKPNFSSMKRSFDIMHKDTTSLSQACNKIFLALTLYTQSLMTEYYNQNFIHNNIDPNTYIEMYRNLKESITNSEEKIIEVLESNIGPKQSISPKRIKKQNDRDDNTTVTTTTGDIKNNSTETSKQVKNKHTQMIGGKVGFKVVGRSDLVASYQGQTAIKTREVLDSHEKLIVVLEEAYRMRLSDQDHYGIESLGEILQTMSEESANKAFIFNGYLDMLIKALFESNEGFESRIGDIYILDDYNYKQIAQIFVQQLSDYGWSLDPSITRPYTTQSEQKEEDDDETRKPKNYLEKFFHRNKPKFPFFGRDTNRLVEKCKIAHNRRIWLSILIHDSRRNKEKDYTMNQIISKEDLDDGYKRYIETICDTKRESAYNNNRGALDDSIQHSIYL